MADTSSRMDRATVEYVARLSRVALSEDDVEIFSRQLGDIVDYINQLGRLDTSRAAPLAQAVEVPNVLREDVECASLSTEEALSNAPEKTSGFYKVPAVLE